MKKIEISWLRKLGFLSGWNEGTIRWTKNGIETGNAGVQVVTHTEGKEHVRFLYNLTDSSGEQSSYDYKHRLTTTSCNYGGARYWFICGLYTNGKYCGRRVGVLYMGEKYFGCRHCLNLTYSSRNENRRSEFYPLVRNRKQRERADKIRIKYYKGNLTKRYRRLLDKGGFLSEESEYQMFRELVTRL